MIIISTSTAGYVFNEIAVRNHVNYCNATGNSYNYYMGKLTDRPASWGKLIHIKNNFASMLENEWLLWIDADAFFINKSFDLAEFVRHRDYINKDMVIAKDCMGNLNCGVWFWRNTEWARSYIEELWGMEQFIKHMWWENMAFIQSWKKYEDKIGITDFASINSFHNSYTTGHNILHIAGEKKQGKLQHAAKFPEVRQALCL